MNESEKFYEKFNSSNYKKRGFHFNFFVPFLSGILGASLVLVISSNANGIKNGIESNQSPIINTKSSSSGTIDYVSLKSYSDTAVYAANKVLPSIVGIKVEYTVTSNFIKQITQIGEAEGSGIIMSSDGYNFRRWIYSYK